MKEVFLQLVRLGIGTELVNNPEFKVQGSIDWPVIKDLAEKQGLSAVVLDGIEKLPEQQRPPKALQLEWIGETLQGYEYRYDLYCKTIAELADLYNKYGFKMMILKGYACSLDWPRPEHRPCGDIDIWLFGQQKEADEVLTELKGIDIDTSHHHHTIFYWREFMVENHYDFIDVHHRKSSPKLEKVFKKLGEDDSNSIELYGEKVYLPNAYLHALFLIYHTMLHFTSTEMNIRQLMDWGLFAEKHKTEIDWTWLKEIINNVHLMDFFSIINTICVEDLGFDRFLLYGCQCDPDLKLRVLNGTLCPEFSQNEPSSFHRRFWFRYRRWKANAWKNKLCYTESSWTIFWMAVWSHILKPSSL